MRVICSYCHAFLREIPGGKPSDVSHGMCEDCDHHFGRLWEGMHLGEYLDELPQAVVVVDSDDRVLAANAKATELLARDPAAPRGLLAGEAMACSHSRLPGGCGKTIHCRECTIRNTVAKVAATGRPVGRVATFLKTAAGPRPLRVSARPKDGAVEVTLEDGDAPTPFAQSPLPHRGRGSG
jgi:PAS domain-containing protein